jgi:hypothetical protein
MISQLTLLINDIKDLITTLTFWDMIPYSMGGMWILLLCVPLSKIDKRDAIACLTYCGFCMAAGIILVFTIHPKYAPETNVTNVLNVSLILLSCSVIRWTYKKRALPSVFDTTAVMEKSNEQKKPDL